jgi:3-hydroxyisobutyrate dehydrogenase-like beta-hydroxyacid dehydrogenase
MFTDKTIAFIGSGVMAEAMIRGLLSQQIIAAGADYRRRAAPRAGAPSPGAARHPGHHQQHHRRRGGADCRPLLQAPGE